MKLEQTSKAQLLASLPALELAKLLASLSDDDAIALQYDWNGFWARPNQLPPEGDWRTWIYLGGRGTGKTRAGIEFVRTEVEAERAGRVAVVARTSADVRDVLVDGESGFLAKAPPWLVPKHEPSKRRLVWPNGAIATFYSAEEPDSLRGPQHDLFLADEFASWQYPDDTWSNLMFGLRLGKSPRGMVTTTPKPIALLRALVKREGQDVAVTRGSTYDNRANLPDTFLTEIIGRYEGTRTGRQEIHAELLDEAEGALWKREWIDTRRITPSDVPETLVTVVVGVDPPGSHTNDSAEAGVVVAGVAANGHGYVLADMSGRYSPDGWGRAAAEGYHRFKADKVVAEKNYGGDMVKYVFRTIDPGLTVRYVDAKRGKATRAEPIAALYEQGMIHHVGGFNELEDQLVTWEPQGGQPSPDRLDALVWALTEIMVRRRYGGPAGEFSALPTTVDWRAKL